MFGWNLDLGLDLGSCLTRIFQRGVGVVAAEPSAVAFSPGTGEVIAAGTEAKLLADQASADARVVFPVRAGALHRVEQGGALDGGGPGGEGDDDTRQEETAPPQHAPEHGPYHLGRGVVVGDHAAAHGEHDAGICGGLIGEQLGLGASGDDLTAAGGERDG